MDSSLSFVLWMTMKQIFCLPSQVDCISCLVLLFFKMIALKTRWNWSSKLSVSGWCVGDSLLYCSLLGSRSGSHWSFCNTHTGLGHRCKYVTRYLCLLCLIYVLPHSNSHLSFLSSLFLSFFSVFLRTIKLIKSGLRTGTLLMLCLCTPLQCIV